MPSFGSDSKSRLQSCHNDLQLLLNEVIKYFDCQVIYGHRSSADQMNLYTQGRKLINKEWRIVDKSKVVTYCDGITNKSKHNENPALAIDIMPYPLDWSDEIAAAYFAGKVMAIYATMKKKGIIRSRIRWGGDWDIDNKTKDEKLVDFPHFEIY